MFLLLCFPLTVSFMLLGSFGGIPAISFILGLLCCLCYLIAYNVLFQFNSFVGFRV